MLSRIVKHTSALPLFAMPLLSFSPLAFGGNAAILAARMNKKLEMKGMPHELDFVSKKTDTWRYKETAPQFVSTVSALVADSRDTDAFIAVLSCSLQQVFRCLWCLPC